MKSLSKRKFTLNLCSQHGWKRGYSRLLAAIFILGAVILHAQELRDCSGAIKRDKPIAVFQSNRRVQKPSESLRVASYNIEMFTDGIADGSRRTREQAVRQAEGAARLLDRINPDILLIQEIENAAALKLLNKRLAKPFPLGWITQFENNGRADDKMNVAFLSRVPVHSVIEMDFDLLEGQACPPRGLLRAAVPLSKGQFLILYNLHLKSNYGDAARNYKCRFNALTLLRRDADALVEKYRDITFEIMVGGDFNTNPYTEQFQDDFSLDPLSDWRDLWKDVPAKEAVTIPQRYSEVGRSWPSETFDRFIVSPALSQALWRVDRAYALQEGTDVRSAETAPGERSHVSDHYPIYVDILR